MDKETCIRVFADLEQINNCRKKVGDAKESVKLLANVMNLGGNEVRLNILYLLWDQDKLCVCDISDILDMRMSAISQHLKKLKDAGVVYNEKVGQTIFYSVADGYSSLFEMFFRMIRKNTVLDTVL